MLVDSTFTLALVTGLSVSDVSMNAVNLGWDEVRLPHPVFAGDTIYARSEVLAKRESTVAAADGDRDAAHGGVQPGGRHGDRVQADDHGVQAGVPAGGAGGAPRLDLYS